MTKTVSSRIPKDLHDKLKERCDDEGCNTNDFIRDVLENELDQESNEEPQSKKPQRIVLDEIEEPKPQRITIGDIPEPTVKEIPQDNSKKPQVNTVLFNNEYIPYAEVYET